MYGTLRDRMNQVFWAWVDSGRRQDAARLCRDWERWWGRTHCR
jgi:hypothetical protein